MLVVRSTVVQYIYGSYIQYIRGADHDLVDCMRAFFHSGIRRGTEFLITAQSVWKNPC